jgi:hypothetical protein
VSIVAGCGSEPRAATPAPPPPASAPSNAAAPVPSDSLLWRTTRGVELWLTLAREGRDTAGATCVERGLEIRDGARRTPVPLLYTRDLPRLVNESTASARLWTHCLPGAEYRIDLRTGQPVRAAR